MDKLLGHQWSPFPYVTGMAPGIYILELSFRNFQSAAAFVESLLTTVVMAPFHQLSYFFFSFLQL